MCKVLDLRYLSFQHVLDGWSASEYEANLSYTKLEQAEAELKCLA